MMSPLENLERYRIVLASASPRRKELLSMLGVDFTVRPLEGVDERYPSTLDAKDVPGFLARLKSDAAAKSIATDELVITADTVVIADGEVLGKPRDAADARRMLELLSGRTHTVITGVAVTAHNRREVASAFTEVEFAELSSAEIEYYIGHYRPFDKAGAYGIQEWIGSIAVKHISGSFYNVMGLPLHLLYTMLRRF